MNYFYSPFYSDSNGRMWQDFFLLLTAMAPQTWTLWKTEQKYLYSFEMWCWRRMEKLSWTNFVKNEEVLHTAKEEWNILHTIQWSKFDWIVQIFCRNCLLKHVIEGKIQGMVRKCKQLVDDLKEKGRYWNLKEVAVDQTVCSTCFRIGCGPVTRQTM
jgi:hypothetical protein